METNWRETSDARSLTILLPPAIDVSKDAIEDAVMDVIDGEDDLDETTDKRKFDRGYKC